MPTIEENREFWNDLFHWGKHQGDIWSDHWGGPEAQWKWCVYPRIRQHLPAGTVLEIGPGMGRWTQFLREFCDHLILVELSPRCLEACRDRFGDEAMEYHLGDGRSLGPIEDDSIDLAKDAESIDDFRAIELVRGVPRPRHTQGEEGKRHGDSAIACALALHASREMDSGAMLFLAAESVV